MKVEVYAVGKHSRAMCPRCGLVCKYRDLKSEVVAGILIKEQKVCPSCWDKDHPQLRPDKHVVVDGQALRSPRIDLDKEESTRIELPEGFDSVEDVIAEAYFK